MSTHLKPDQIRTLHLWALGVGIVVCGQYFGWNLGLKANGPVPSLIASLLVCLLFLAWVLTLAELAVAMPCADGPLEYGCRAGSRWLGFFMGWSMLLECLFGGIATALATGGYVAFLFDPAAPSKQVAMAAGLGCVMFFFFLHAWGVSESARALVLMTWAALLGLVVFWGAAATHFSWDRFWTTPVVPASGWMAVLDGIPFALWWLIIIEAAALAAEESHLPARSIPRGLTYAILTVVVLVLLTTVTACAALDAGDIAERDGKKIAYPLAEVLRRIPIGGTPALVHGFGVLALFGLIASYHGLLYGSSRQMFALGRAGLLPRWLGLVHSNRCTPVPALLVTSVVTAGFVVANCWYDEAIEVAVLTAGFAALVLYILSMVALWSLRRRAPELFHGFRAPLPHLLPIVVVGLSVLGLLVYPRMEAAVLPLSLALYAVGAAYFAWYTWGRKALPIPSPRPSGKSAPISRTGWLEGFAAAALLLVGLALVGVGILTWMPISSLSDNTLAAGLLALLGLTIALVSAVALHHTR